MKFILSLFCFLFLSFHSAFALTCPPGQIQVGNSCVDIPTNVQPSGTISTQQVSSVQNTDGSTTVTVNVNGTANAQITSNCGDIGFVGAGTIALTFTVLTQNPAANMWSGVCTGTIPKNWPNGTYYINPFVWISGMSGPITPPSNSTLTINNGPNALFVPTVTMGLVTADYNPDGSATVTYSMSGDASSNIEGDGNPMQQPNVCGEIGYLSGAQNSGYVAQADYTFIRQPTFHAPIVIPPGHNHGPVTFPATAWAATCTAQIPAASALPGLYAISQVLVYDSNHFYTFASLVGFELPNKPVHEKKFAVEIGPEMDSNGNGKDKTRAVIAVSFDGMGGAFRFFQVSGTLSYDPNNNSTVPSYDIRITPISYTAQGQDGLFKLAAGLNVLPIELNREVLLGLDGDIKAFAVGSFVNAQFGFLVAKVAANAVKLTHFSSIQSNLVNGVHQLNSADLQSVELSYELGAQVKLGQGTLYFGYEKSGIAESFGGSKASIPYTGPSSASWFASLQDLWSGVILKGAFGTETYSDGSNPAESFQFARLSIGITL